MARTTTHRVAKNSSAPPNSRREDPPHANAPSASLLDFSPELVASSIVDLWDDLAIQQSWEGFLRFHREWIAYAVLVSCKTEHGADTIERVIEIACCLDLLCQQHAIAVAVVQSLRIEAVSRISAWLDVRLTLVPKIDEILSGRLADGVHGAPVFRAPRSQYLERWILARPYFNEHDLLAESLRIQPLADSSPDIESRIHLLEVFVEAIENQDPYISGDHNPESEEFDGYLSVLDEDFSDADTDSSWSSNTAHLDAIAPIESLSATHFPSLALATSKRVSERFETLVQQIHSRRDE
jgi:hypothetical protein